MQVIPDELSYKYFSPESNIYFFNLVVFNKRDIRFLITNLKEIKLIAEFKRFWKISYLCWKLTTTLFKFDRVKIELSVACIENTGVMKNI